MIDIDDMKKLAGSRKGEPARVHPIRFGRRYRRGGRGDDVRRGGGGDAEARRLGPLRPCPWRHHRYPRSRPAIPIPGPRCRSGAPCPTASPRSTPRATSRPISSKAWSPPTAPRPGCFKLLKGVTFHNGKSFTAEDVIASYRYHMGPNSKSAAKSLLQAVTDIKADGPDTVVFTLTGGNADFPYICSDYHIPILPAKPDGTADWQIGQPHRRLRLRLLAARRAGQAEAQHQLSQIGQAAISTM